MKLYINPSTNPYFNLAAEEYLLTHADDDIIMLWRNEPSVIIGKNQNAFAEINFDFVREHGIKVVRRLTGGGAVFHDLGNVNYTFISPSNGHLSEGIRTGGLDFAHFTAPIISALRELGLDAALSGRNDIVVVAKDGERKISGNAQCVMDGTTLHHGTLLFSAQLEKLSGALNVDPQKLKSKGIVSVRSRVANIRELLPQDHCERLTDAKSFMGYLSERLSHDFGAVCQAFPDEMIFSVNELVSQKYSSDEWNLRRFGNFSTVTQKRFDFGSVEIRFEVEAGRISAIEFAGDFFGEADISLLSKALTGVRYSREAVSAALDGIEVSRCISGASTTEITNLLLSVTTVL